ncbi:MAG: flagellar basal body-associated FliL family protein [Clostridiales bacterium]|nr:flagellar basal body-associated FliL family protein [Clostridiales bacterium]
MEKNKVMMITIIALLVILLGAIVSVSLYAFRIVGGQREEAPLAADSAIRLSVDQIEKVPLVSPISTNLLADRDGAAHYVKLNLAVGVNATDKKESPKMVESLASNEIVTRDIILAILRNRTYSELNQPDGQELLKDDIKTKLQEEYGSNLIVQIYISDLAFS